MACIGEDDLLALIRGERGLGDSPEVEAHLADCPSCCALLAASLAAETGERPAGWGDLAGRMLGPYRLQGQIGAGASGEVYRALDTRLARHVAVKVLSPRLAGSPEQVRRLEVEGRAAASISHPNVVTVHDTGSAGGVPFIVSELIDGESLRSVIDRGPLPRARALALGLDLARGLAAAHARGVVHRDLKPRNILVTREGTLKILDFGLARLPTPPDAADLDATPPGAVLGTVGYMSPEQARGEPADARSDLFAAGAILYEMLCGERAFGGATFAERLSSVLRDTPARLSAGALGEAFPVVARCLEKDPRDRFQSAQDLAWVLEGLLAGRARGAANPMDASRAGATSARPARAIPRRAVLLAAATATGGAALGVALGRGRTPATQQPVYQQLTYRHGHVPNARFTRDGGSVVYAAAWDGSPLSVFTIRVGGGGTRPLVLPPADVLSVSSRGQIALCLGRRYVEGMHTSGTLAVAPLEGGEPRPLAEDIQEADFSPDGRDLLVIRRGPRGFSLEMPPGEVLFETAEWPNHGRVSPGGERIAFLLHPEPNDDRGAVVVIERRGGPHRVVSEGWSSLSGLAWSPDGREILVTAARQGADTALRTISLDGRETQITGTIGRLRLHDVARDGRALVTHDTWRVRSMVRPKGGAAEIDVSLSDISLVGDLSDDGTTVALAEFGDVELETGAAGAYVRPLGGGQALRLDDGMPVDLSGDGRRALVIVGGIPSVVNSYSIGTSEQSTLRLGSIERVISARWRGDDVVLVGAAAGRAPRLWLVRRGAPAPEPVSDEGLSGICHVSPDGASVALLSGDGRCALIALDPPGGARVVPGTYRGDAVCGFTPSGELLVRGAGTPIRVRRVDVATGESSPVAEIAPPALGLKGVDAFMMSATGEAYAYSYGQELSCLYVTGPRPPA